MATDSITMFWNEVELIQQRHSLFFPVEQKEFISIKELDNRIELFFLEDYNLSSVITMEIKFAFKLINR